MDTHTLPENGRVQDARAHERATALWKRWADMWNGEPEAAHEIVAPGIQLRYNGRSAPGASEIHDAAALAAWVTAFRAKFDNLTFTLDLGPLVDGDMCTFRWYAKALYIGATGFPQDVPGESFARAGIDIWRVADGRIAEVWSMSTEA